MGDNVLFNILNNYHPNMKVSIELNPGAFLDNKRTNINGFYKFNFQRKSIKLKLPWTSKNLKRYKQNTINDDLHRSKRILSKLDEEIPLIKKKFMKAGQPLRFINSANNEFHKGKNHGDKSFL